MSPLFFLVFQAENPADPSGPPRGICSSGESYGDLHFTDFVPPFHVFFHDKVCFFTVFPIFFYQDSFLATQDPSRTVDLEILIYWVVLKH